MVHGLVGVRNGMVMVLCVLVWCVIVSVSSVVGYCLLSVLECGLVFFGGRFGICWINRVALGIH
jgi:hypothetical protein